MREWIIAIVIAFGIIVVLVKTGIATEEPTLKMRKEIVSLQLDYEELRKHTEILASIISVQQYQLDVLTEKN